jgi:cytochrome P450
MTSVIAPVRPKPAPIVDLDDPAFDPFVGDALAFGDIVNPFPRLHELARQNWVHPGEYRGFFSDLRNAAMEKYDYKYFTVFGYDNCAENLPNAELFSNYPLALTIGTSFGRTISGMDPPEHTRFRRIFQKAFLPQTVRKWGEALVQPVVDSLLDKVAGQDRCDLVEDFTFHYPFQVIYRQLDLPPEDIRIFHKLAITQTTFYYAPQTAIEAGEKLGVYFTAMVRARRESPGEDLVSALALAEADGERLPEEVVVSFLRQLTNAGGDTTYRGTSVLLAALLAHPDQLEAVRNDRSLVGAAIEEALRWDGPVMTATRMTTRDVAIHGFTFPKDSIVEFVQGQGNRDETKFADPDRFDIRRDRTHRHLAFTTGPHVCIGQHLARVEMERALNAILDRFPKVRLDPDAPPPETRGFTLRTPRHIHVRID